MNSILLLSVVTVWFAASTKAFVPTTPHAYASGLVTQYPTKPTKNGVTSLTTALKVASDGLIDTDTSSVLQDADAIFTIIDVDGDGSITREELMNHMGKAGYADAAVEKIFDALDSNKDGVISQEEFRSGLVKFAQLRSAPGLGDYNSQFASEIHTDADFLFRTIDADGNGSISMDELRGHITDNTQSLQETKYSEVAMRKIFRMMDVNDDGDISREEMRDAFVRYSALRQALGEGPNYK